MNTIASALRRLADEDERAFSTAAGGDALMRRARRGRRRRVAAQTATASAATVALAVGGAVGWSAFHEDERAPVDPGGAPPEGYTRAVIALGVGEGFIADEGMTYQQMIICGEDSPVATGPVAGVSLSLESREYSGSSLGSAGVASTFTYEGPDMPFPSSLILAYTVSDATGRAVYSEAFDAVAPGLLPGDVALAPGSYGPMGRAAFGMSCFLPGAENQETLAPGEYRVNAIAALHWSLEGAVVVNAEDLGYERSWFGAEWRTELPCASELASARGESRGIVQCAPGLAVVLVYGATPSAYALVDVPAPVALRWRGSAPDEILVVSESARLLITPGWTSAE